MTTACQYELHLKESLNAGGSRQRNGRQLVFLLNEHDDRHGS